MIREPGGPPPPAQPDWGYFLDVDGTLIEIAALPEAVHVPQALIRLLGDLHCAVAGACALVSGRRIADLDAMFAPLRLPACGIHGMEWRQDDAPVESGTSGATDAEASAAIAAARTVLADFVRCHQGAVLEDKGTALALHYRAAPDLAAEVAAAGEALLADHPVLMAQPGKMVLEIRPRGVDKGVAVRRLLAVPPFSGRQPVYVGDDLTDEHAFEEVNAAGGLSIRVGDRAPTHACWRLPTVAAVHRWLAPLVGGCGEGASHDVA